MNPFEPSADQPAHPGDDAVSAALDALRLGQPVLIAEDMAAGKAVWAVMPAQLASAEAVNLLASAARGVLSVTLTAARARALDCMALERRRAPVWLPHYGVSVEAAEGVSTGISAEDRGLTARILADPNASERELVRPGHIMPIIVGDRGVLDAPYGPEAAHDLMILAGMQPAALVSHMLVGFDEARPEDADALAAEHGWPLVRVSQVLSWRAGHERLVHVIREGLVNTVHGPLKVRLYANEIDGTSHVALFRDAQPQNPDDVPLVRMHSQCLTGDILHSQRCDCGAQLQAALAQVARSGCGAVLYLRQEGRGIGLLHKIRAYALQDQGQDTVEANVALGFAPDERDYAVAAQMLRDLGMTRLRLLTNNPTKMWALQSLGLQVVERVPIEVAATADNLRYLQTKRDRMGHWLTGVDQGSDLTNVNPGGAA